MFIFALFVTAFVIALFGSLIVGDNSDIVFYGFDNNEFNRLRFLFIQVRHFFYSDFDFFLSV